ncbi:MAG TPA: molecular chaperone DnaJ, partial [Allocoleopsis sp.]
ACLELGREQWQQGQYENAALSLETGQEILLKEGLFASLRGEISLDIFKLRPYRILELLSLPESNETERKTGLQLLKAMLNDRGGMEGSGDDQSGLSVDDFLRFIQQLRSYMTAAEQQNLFEIEAIRPSAVATFLAVYALLARGFNQRNPAYIRQAKTMLMRLSQRQDVYIEQAICAMLLGQTDEATEYLQKSQDQETLKFIKEHSQDSPDLLPGLCLYGEKWLQSEVFPHFRDLANRHTALTEYFADEQVQAYLENMPDELETANEWSIFMPQSTNYNQPATVTSTSSVPIINTDNQQLLSELNLSRNGRVNLTIEKPDIDLNNITTAERIAVNTVEQSNNNIN